MILRSCRLFLILLAAIGLFSYLLGCAGVRGGIEQYVGEWLITLLDSQGEEAGTGQFEVAEDGDLTGTVALRFLTAQVSAAQAEGQLIATVAPDGTISDGIIKDPNQNTVATFAGSLQADAGSGTWRRSGSHADGTWTATRVEPTPTPAVQGTPTPTPTGGVGPTPTAGPTATPTPGPTPTPTPVPVLEVAPTTLTLSNSDPSEQLTVSNTGAGSLDWQATTNVDWLDLDLASGTIMASGSQTVNVTADTTGLVAGEYTATVTFISNGGTQTVEVTLVVTETTIVIS